MANGHSNGYDPGRLDRIERAVESLVNRHLEFEDEHKRLLTAQMVLTDRLDKLTQEVRDLRQNAADSDARMDALITVVDDLVRRNPPRQ